MSELSQLLTVALLERVIVLLKLLFKKEQMSEEWWSDSLLGKKGKTVKNIKKYKFVE